MQLWRPGCPTLQWTLHCDDDDGDDDDDDDDDDGDGANGDDHVDDGDVYSNGGHPLQTMFTYIKFSILMIIIKIMKMINHHGHVKMGQDLNHH